MQHFYQREFINANKPMGSRSPCTIKQKKQTLSNRHSNRQTNKQTTPQPRNPATASLQPTPYARRVAVAGPIASYQSGRMLATFLAPFKNITRLSLSFSLSLPPLSLSLSLSHSPVCSLSILTHWLLVRSLYMVSVFDAGRRDLIHTGHTTL